MNTSLSKWKLLASAVLVAWSTSLGAENPPGATGPESKDEQVIVPKETIHLFDGRTLTNFYTWLVDFKRSDPACVYSVVDAIDGGPAIRISGQYFGGLTTKSGYANYHLIAECRWGLLTWAERKSAAKDSGILVHGQGEDGSYFSKDFNGPWMRSYEFQIIEGGMGDILVLAAYDLKGNVVKAHLTAPVIKDRDGEPVWDAAGTPTTFDGGRVNWCGRDPDWVDQLGFRGKQDVESPHGEWTRLEIFCKGDSLKYLVNGKVVNQASACSLTSGRILLQSEGAEIFFRRVDLEPLP